MSGSIRVCLVDIVVSIWYVIKQNESKVGSDMLLVSDALFHLNIMSMSMLNQALVASIY